MITLIQHSVTITVTMSLLVLAGVSSDPVGVTTSKSTTFGFGGAVVEVPPAVDVARTKIAPAPPASTDQSTDGGTAEDNMIPTYTNSPTESVSVVPKKYEVITVEFQRVETPYIIGLWIFLASIAKIGFHMTPRLNRIFPESCLLITVGVLIGILLYITSSLRVSPLTPDTFFIYMLPPIILDAGYFMPNRLFFDHLGTILLFAVVGTIFNTLTIGASLWAVGQSGLFDFDCPLLDMFLFSALISAVDPVAVLAVFEEIHVDEILYIVVFGESLLNDAVTVVLYHMFEVYSEIGPSNITYEEILKGAANFFIVALGGTFIGVVWGFLTGFVTRFTHEVRVIEPIFIFVMAYLAYLSAEIFHMSGILAITFCGITMKNYVEANISQKSHTTIKYAMKMLSSSSETIIFMFLGVATVNDSHIWNTWFVVLTIFFCSIYRVLGVILLTAIANHFRVSKLNKVEKFVMSYGGLRGAVAFALVLLIDPRHVKLQPMFVTTTIAVIYFTVFIQGITIKPLVKILNVKRAEKRKPTMNERIHERFIDHMMAGIEDITGKHGNYHVRDKFKRFDNKFIRPYLLRDHKGAEPKILETFSKLAMKDAMDYMRRNASTIGNISGTESMSAIFKNYTTNNLNPSPSLTQLDSSTWNIDLQELEYNPTKKDLTDAKIHHLLSEELCKPRRHRRLSYSRHAVNDKDLTTQEVNYRIPMNYRRVIGERKHHHKRSKKQTKDGKQNHVSFPEFQQNGSAIHLTNDFLDTVLHEDEQEPDNKAEWEGITFTARSTHDQIKETNHGSSSKRNSTTSDCDSRVTTPTATETMLPWKRDDSDYAMNTGPVKQSEFPAWCSNKEYIAYNSPSATFLGGIDKPKPASVIGLFRRESSGSMNGIRSRANSDSSIQPAHNGAAGATGGVLLIEEGVSQMKDSASVGGGIGASGSNTSVNTRRPLIGRKGSMLELNNSVDIIPEEDIITGSIALLSPQGSLPSLTDGLLGHQRANQPRLTPYTQARRQHALGQRLTSSDSSNSSLDDDSNI